MTNTKELRAARKFGPGYFIREQMEFREWTSEEMAEATGLPKKQIEDILMDKLQLNFETAEIVAKVFNTSSQYWVNLNTGYQQWLLENQIKR